MAIKLGNLDISAFKVGSGDCSIYLGDTKLYPNESPTYVFSANYTDGTSYFGNLCDGSSVLLVTGITRAHSSSVDTMSSATIGDCVISVQSGCFSGCTSLRTLNSDVEGVFNIPNGVIFIDSNVFSKCSGMTSVNIPNSVKTINSAFQYCTSLTSVTVPNSITQIEYRFCYACSGLLTVNLPSTITKIYGESFANCTSLQSITILATTPPALMNVSAFLYTNDCPIYVPSGSVDTYKAASRWSDYASRIQAIPTV